MNIKEFAQYVLDTVQDSVETNNTNIETEIARYYLDCMEECEEVSAPDICTFSSPKAKLTAYGYNDEAESLDLFLFIHVTPLASRVDSRIRSGFNSLREFYDQCIKRKASFGGMEKEFNSEVQEAISTIRESKGNVKIIRFYLLTDGVVSSSDEISSPDKDEDGVICEYNIWDIAKVYQQEQIKQGNNKIEIDFEHDIKYFVPSKEAKNNTLVSPKIQCLKVDDENPCVDTYLAIIPGDILAKIYNQYRSLLLEKNVRAFLHNKSKVNQRIMSTIRNKPEMFFSYNNGISTTASDVELKQTGRVQYITKLKDWQIVNGGQTTASIASAKDCDLSKVYVQMKVSVVKDREKYSEIVKSISRCANSQTGIKPSDFDSGEEYLIKLEKLSNDEITPISKTKWFFERMRGQYTDKRASLNKIEEDLFKRECPKDQMLTKIDVARVMVIWDMKPHIACNSREKCFASYMFTLRKNQQTIDVDYWHKVVALSILYDEIEKCYEKRCESKGFKSRTAAYTMSAISYLTNQELDLVYIWKNEKVQPQLEEIIERLVVKINCHLDLDNSRSFTKNAKCWEDMKDLIEGCCSIPYSLLSSSSEDNYSEEEYNIIAQANAITKEWWNAVLEWNKTEKTLSQIEKITVSNYIKKMDDGRFIKTINNAEKAIAIKNKVEHLGFSMNDIKT